MDNKDTGLLLNKNDIALHRMWFKQMVKLLGINVIFRAPRKSKDYDLHGELDTKYYEDVVVGVIFEEHPTQKTAKKLGWNSELAENSTLMVCPYDLQGLERGAEFILPAALDNAEGRRFRVIKMMVTPVYPCSITCELEPIWESTSTKSEIYDFTKSNFNVLISEEEEE
jgi:hypothetical protein